MNTRDFLQLVLPEQDNYVLFISKPDGRQYNINCSTLDECCQTIARLDASVATVYFAVGKHGDNEQITPTGLRKTLRKQQTATYFKSLCLDIDIGPDHVYQTQGEGAKALQAACDTLGLPTPMLVSSGTGVHAYFPLQEAIGAQAWTALSSCLQAALHAHGVDLDNSKIKDASMVLRPAGTHHKKDPKHWKEVRVVRPADPSPAMAIANCLVKYRDAVVTSRPASERRSSTAMSAVLDGSDYPPVVLDDVRGCAQLAAILDSGGATNSEGDPVEEPLWRATLGIAKFTEDTADAIVKLAGGHPDFDFQDSKEKMEAYQGTGPTLCASFENLNPAGCDGCPYRGKIKTPAALSRGEETVTAQISYASDDTAPIEGASVPVQSITVPGYTFKGGKLVYRPPSSDEDVLIAEYNFFVVGAVSTQDEDQQTIKIAVEMPEMQGAPTIMAERWRVIDVPLSAITKGGHELLTALALRQVYIRQDIERVKKYLMSYLAELQKRQRMQYFYRCFGWQEDGSFLAPTGIIGGTDDGRVPHYEGAVSGYVPHMQPKGDLETWVKATQMFDMRGMENHATVFLMMAGSILLEACNINSALVNMYSSDSGSGKTIVGSFGLSIWGNPAKLQRIVTDTEKSLYKHFGLMHSLGAYIDEITAMDPDRFRHFVYNIPEGREPDRLLSSADGFRQGETWRMPIFASSNTDAYDVLSTRLTSEAEKYRVLQFPMHRMPFFADSKNGYFISRALHENYGQVGPLLVKEILARGGPQALMSQRMAAVEEFFSFDFHGPERFYRPLFACAWAIGDIMRDLGLIKFDPVSKIVASLPVVRDIRRAAVEETMDGLDMIGQFMTEHGHAIVLLRVRPDSHGNVRQDITPPPHRAAVARSEVERDKDGTFVSGLTYINSTAFKKWCRNNGAEYKSAIRDLRNAGVKVREGVRKSLYKGAEGYGAVGQTTCLEIDVASHTRLIESHDLLTSTSIGGTPRLVSVTK